jgi:hypothetical protein
MRNFRKIALLPLIALVPAFVAAPALAAALTEPQVAISALASTTPTSVYQSPDLTSCFNYYRFGSVPVAISGTLTQVAQGSTLGLTGTITNENVYPIIGASVYAKVFHKRGITKDSFGPDVVDWFPIEENLTLKASETEPVQFMWKVPRNLDPGDYEIATYVAAQDRFNLLGLTFTNDIVGGIYNFSVSGDATGATRFDLAGTILGNQVVHAAAFAPAINIPGTDVPISARVVNSSASGFHGTLDWKLYWWDSLLDSHLIAQSEEEVKVQPHSDTTVNYTVKDTAHAVYYLVGTLTPADPTLAKSIVEVRFIRNDVDEPRLNFVGVTGYPAEAGTTTLFACFHSSGRDPSENVRVEVSAQTLSDPISSFLFGDRVLAEKSYTGEAPGIVTAISAPFNAPSSSFELTARLYQDDKLIDEVTIPYQCDALGASCGNSRYLGIEILAGLVILALAAWGGVRLVRRKHPSRNV